MTSDKMAILIYLAALIAGLCNMVAWHKPSKLHKKDFRKALQK